MSVGVYKRTSFHSTQRKYNQCNSLSLEVEIHLTRWKRLLKSKLNHFLVPDLNEISINYNGKLDS